MCEWFPCRAALLNPRASISPPYILLPSEPPWVSAWAAAASRWIPDGGKVLLLTLLFALLQIDGTQTNQRQSAGLFVSNDGADGPRIEAQCVLLQVWEGPPAVVGSHLRASYFFFSLCTLRMCERSVKGNVLLVGCSLILTLDIKTASVIHRCCLSLYVLHKMPQFHVLWSSRVISGFWPLWRHKGLKGLLSSQTNWICIHFKKKNLTVQSKKVNLQYSHSLVSASVYWNTPPGLPLPNYYFSACSGVDWCVTFIPQPWARLYLQVSEVVNKHKARGGVGWLRQSSEESLRLSGDRGRMCQADSANVTNQQRNQSTASEPANATSMLISPTVLLFLYL